MVVLRLQVVHQQLSAIFQHMYLDKKRNGENAHGNVGMQPMGMGTMQPAGMPLQQQGGYPGSINENQAAEIVYAWMKEQPDPDNQGFKQDYIVAGALPSSCGCTSGSSLPAIDERLFVQRSLDGSRLIWFWQASRWLLPVPSCTTLQIQIPMPAFRSLKLPRRIIPLLHWF